MEPPTPPQPLPQQLSCFVAVCNVENVTRSGPNATLSSTTDSDGVKDPEGQAWLVTLQAPRSTTKVISSPPSMRLTSQTLLPEGVVSADLSRDAQSSMQIGMREGCVDETTLRGCRDREYPLALGEADGPSAEPMPSLQACPTVAVASMVVEEAAITKADNGCLLRPASGVPAVTGLSDLPNEALLQILRYLDVCDLLCTSRTSHRLRDLSLAPILHAYRLQRTRTILPPMLWSPFRPSLADLIHRSIFLTRTTVVSRKLARSLVCIRLSRRLAARPSVEALVARSVLPPECLPSKKTAVAPALVAKKRAVERERVKDSLRRWVERVWRGEVKERSEGVKLWEEKVGVGRVWRLRRFWESVGNGQIAENR